MININNSDRCFPVVPHLMGVQCPCFQSLLRALLRHYDMLQPSQGFLNFITIENMHTQKAIIHCFGKDNNKAKVVVSDQHCHFSAKRYNSQTSGLFGWTFDFLPLPGPSWYSGLLPQSKDMQIGQVVTLKSLCEVVSLYQSAQQLMDTLFRVHPALALCQLRLAPALPQPCIDECYRQGMDGFQQ